MEMKFRINNYQHVVVSHPEYGVGEIMGLAPKYLFEGYHVAFYEQETPTELIYARASELTELDTTFNVRQQRARELAIKNSK
jgi:hypothetical protein